jgi:hypothetical protein
MYLLTIKYNKVYIHAVLYSPDVFGSRFESG